MTPLQEQRDGAGPLDTVPIGARQMLVLVAALLLATLDGYDALSMAFVAPALSHDWHLGKALLGLLLASGLVGMAIGSLALSPLADTVGRRPVVLAGLLLMAAGSTLSAFAHSAGVLIAFRILTGVGIGVMIAMTTLISAEFSNLRHRALAVASVTTVGFPLGGIIGGLTASALLPTLGWAWVFLIGGIAGGLLLLLLIVVLPESPVYLAALRSPDALSRVNHVLSGLRQPTLAALPPVTDRRRVAYRALFAPGVARQTIRLVIINLLVATCAYYMLNWMPQLIADMGFPPATGSSVSAFSGFVGLPGGVLFGALAARFVPARLAAVAMIGMGLSVAALGLTPPRFALLLLCGGCFGFSLAAATGSFYGIIAAGFSPLMRASGIGLVMGLGRVASAIGPALAGLMFAAKLTRAEVSLTFAAGPMIAAVLIALSARTTVAVDVSARGHIEGIV